MCVCVVLFFNVAIQTLLINTEKSISCASHEFVICMLHVISSWIFVKLLVLSKVNACFSGFLQGLVG